MEDYVWTAGLATELVNTAAEVWQGEDHLPDRAALLTFAELHGDGSGALTRLARRGRAADLRAVHALRTTVRHLIDHPGHLVAGATALTAPGQGLTLISSPTNENHTHWAVPLHDGATISDALSLICGIGILGVVHTIG
ncbi:MAG: ABATE domain-containing protein, partial [Acidimicrobiales bacterium]